VFSTRWFGLINVLSEKDKTTEFKKENEKGKMGQRENRARVTGGKKYPGMLSRAGSRQGSRKQGKRFDMFSFNQGPVLRRLHILFLESRMLIQS